MTATQQHSNTVPLSNGVFITPQDELSMSAWLILKQVSTGNEGIKTRFQKSFTAPVYQDTIRQYKKTIMPKNRQIQRSIQKIKYIKNRFINGTLLKLKNHFNLSARFLNTSCFTSRSFSIGNAGVKNE